MHAVLAGTFRHVDMCSHAMEDYRALRRRTKMHAIAEWRTACWREGGVPQAHDHHHSMLA
jgi:hypothetical protein